MPKGIYLTLKDLMILEGIKWNSTASTALQTIRDSLGKQKHEKVTVREYATYRGVSFEEINAVIGG